MDVRDPEPDVRPSQNNHYDFYPTSTSSHHLRLSITMILTILNLTPVIIRNPKNPNTIIFAQPYITKWLVVPYAAYYLRTSKLLLIGQHWNGTLDPKVRSISATSDDLLITEPRTIIWNLRVGLLTYRLCGGVLMCDVSYLWVTYILPKMWNSLPPYVFGQWRLELAYVVVAVSLLVALILGPGQVLVIVCGYGSGLWMDATIVQRLCAEKVELEERVRKGGKEP